MRHALVLALFLLAAASGCDWRESSGIGADPSISIAADPPPRPETWPRYPQSWPESCWGRGLADGVMRAAPSFVPRRATRPIPPGRVVEKLLARFGDRRFIRDVRLRHPPPDKLDYVHEEMLWAYIVAPEAREGTVGLTPEAAGRKMVARWQAELVGGALRDDLCDAGGQPLAGLTFGPTQTSFSDRDSAFGQRFPNPSPRAFRERLRLVGRKYGFRVVSLRLLRPRQLAPLLIVETDRDRKLFVEDVGAIVSLLDPREGGATTFEGFFLEARDDDGPFVRVASVFRGQWAGSEWSWDPCVSPYHRSQLVGSRCP